MRGCKPGPFPPVNPVRGWGAWGEGRGGLVFITSGRCIILADHLISPNLSFFICETGPIKPHSLMVRPRLSQSTADKRCSAGGGCFLLPLALER